MLLEKKTDYVRRIALSALIDAHGCWIWQKKLSNNGYGEYAFGKGKNGRAHRVSYFAHVGEIPDGMDVCHRCDVRACVNPDHLFLGSRSDNLQDASRKRRLSRTHQKKGSAHPASKLREEDIPVIRRRLETGHPKARIARDYGISDRVVLLIARGEAWRHV